MTKKSANFVSNFVSISDNKSIMKVHVYKEQNVFLLSKFVYSFANKLANNISNYIENYMYYPSTRGYFYRCGIFKYQRLSWKSCAPPLVFPSGSFVARIIT